jgi:hypothetical protein
MGQTSGQSHELFAFEAPKSSSTSVQMIAESNEMTENKEKTTNLRPNTGITTTPDVISQYVKIEN